MNHQQFITDGITDAENETARAVASARRENADSGTALSQPESADQSTETEEQNTLTASELAAQAEKMIAEMREEIRLHSRLDTMANIWSVVLFPAVILFPMCFGGSIFGFHWHTIWQRYGTIFFLLPTLILSMRTLVFDIIVGKRTLKALHRIEAMDDLRLVGPLAEMLGFGSPSVHDLIKAQLMRLLPLIKESDAALLDRVQRCQLNRFVSIHRYEPKFFIGLWLKRKQQRKIDTDFQLAIFAAYEQIGDASSLVAVQSLAHPSPEYLKIVPPEIVKAAKRCLTFVSTANRHYGVSKQLLRPASASDVMPDTLLRAANNQPAKDESDSLLRAADSVDAPVASHKGKALP